MAFNIFSLKPWQIFLIDGMGALLSAILLCVVQYYKEVFGVPDAMFQLLIPFQVLFACYSFTCLLSKSGKQKILLTVIIICNVLYALYSLLLVYLNADQLSTIGIIYFMLEILVILLLVSLELRWRKTI